MYADQQFAPYQDLSSQFSGTPYPTSQNSCTENYPRSHSPRTVKRINSNARKRLRQHIVNEAFLQLRDMVPSRRPEKKMSKLQILKSATKYIDFLTHILRQEEELESNKVDEQEEEEDHTVGMVSSTTDPFFEQATQSAIQPPPSLHLPDQSTKHFYFSDDDFY